MLTLSWVNTLLDVGIISMQISQRQKLEQLQQQNAEAKLIQAIVEALRNEIFKYRETAKVILGLETQTPKVAAAAMLILNARLQKLDVNPQMFPHLSDKEYVADTIRIIESEGERLLRQLNASQKREVASIVKAATSLPDYSFYIENYEPVKKYKEAVTDYNKLKGINSGCLKSVVFLGLLVTLPGFMAFSISAITATSFADSTFVFGSCAGFLGVFILYFLFSNRIAQSPKYKAAKKHIEEFKKQGIDLEHFEALDRKFGSRYGRTVAARDALYKQVESFFTAVV